MLIPHSQQRFSFGTNVVHCTRDVYVVQVILYYKRNSYIIIYTDYLSKLIVPSLPEYCAHPIHASPDIYSLLTKIIEMMIVPDVYLLEVDVI